MVKARGFDAPLCYNKKEADIPIGPFIGFILAPQCHYWHCAVSLFIGTVPSVYSSVSFQVQLTNLNSPLLWHSNTMVSAFVAPS